MSTEIKAYFGNGKPMSGWESMEINKSITELAHSFSMSISPQMANEFKVSDKITIDAYDHNMSHIMTVGYADAAEYEDTVDGMRISLSGRSVHSDLIDSEITASYKNLTLATIARKLCSPFGIEVIDSAGTKVVSDFAPHCQTIFSALGEHAKKQNVIMVGDGLGRLLFFKKERRVFKTPLIQGKNILTLNRRCEFLSYKDYIVYGADGIKGRAVDSSVKRPRVKMINSPESKTHSECNASADFEKKKYTARGETYTVTLPGWFAEKDGVLWEVNRKVQLDYPLYKINKQYLIKSATFSLEKTKYQTTLELINEDAVE